MNDLDFSEFPLIDILRSTRTALDHYSIAAAQVPTLNELKDCLDEAIDELESESQQRPDSPIGAEAPRKLAR
jgi:hypothetical protein